MATPEKVLVLVDEENGSEEWWEALRRRFPALADELERDGSAKVSREELAQLQQLPGWDTGPEHAPNPLVILESAD